MSSFDASPVYLFLMGAAENERKHDDLSEWDPWVEDPWLTKNYKSMEARLYAWNDLDTPTLVIHTHAAIDEGMESDLKSSKTHSLEADKTAHQEWAKLIEWYGCLFQERNSWTAHSPPNLPPPPLQTIHQSPPTSQVLTIFYLRLGITITDDPKRSSEIFTRGFSLLQQRYLSHDSKSPILDFGPYSKHFALMLCRLWEMRRVRSNHLMVFFP